MNAHDRDFATGEPARLHYGDGDYAVLRPGRYVLCAVTGRKVPLEQLRYWSAELVGSSRVDLQACKLEYSIVSPK